MLNMQCSLSCGDQYQSIEFYQSDQIVQNTPPKFDHTVGFLNRAQMFIQQNSFKP